MNNEIKQRQEKAQKLMRDKDYSALVLAAAENIQYFTGVMEPSVHTCGVLVFSNQGQPVMAVMSLDADAARQQAKEVNIDTYTPDTRGSVIAKTLERLGAVKGQVGMDSRALEGLGRALNRSLPNLETVNAANNITALRSVKSEEEINSIQKACQIAEQGMKTAIESLKTGISELQVATLAKSQMIALGSDDMKHQPIIASGPRTRLIHPFASQKEIANGDIVSIDFGAVYNGYCSDIARTCIVGKPDEKIKDAFNALRSVQDAVLLKLQPGITVKEVVILAQEASKSAGYQLVGHVGHGVGLSVEEYPTLILTEGLDPNIKIESNMVLAFFQSSIEREQNLGIRLEDTVLITDSGAKPLTTYPRELFICM